MRDAVAFRVSRDYGFTGATGLHVVHGMVTKEAQIIWLAVLLSCMACVHLI